MAEGRSLGLWTIARKHRRLEVALHRKMPSSQRSESSYHSVSQGGFSVSHKGNGNSREARSITDETLLFVFFLNGRAFRMKAQGNTNQGKSHLRCQVRGCTYR